MPKLIWFSTLSLAIATTSLPAIAQTPTEPTVPTEQPIPSTQPIPYERTAPRISRTSGFSDTHYISLYTGEQPLSYVVVRPPQFVSVSNNNIDVTDQLGQKIDANITREGDKIRITFAQPVAPATTLQIALKNLGFDTPNRSFYLYELAGGYTSYRREIPYGFAQVQIF